MPGENVNRGAVNVVYDSARGLTAAGNQLWTQDSPGTKGMPGGEFGDAVAAENFGRGAQADLAVAGNLGNGAQADLAVGVPGAAV